MHKDKDMKRACALAVTVLALVVGSAAFADDQSDPVTGWLCRTNINSNPQVEVVVAKQGNYYSMRAIETDLLAGPVIVSEVSQANERQSGGDLVYEGSSPDASLELSIAKYKTQPVPYPDSNLEALRLPAVLKISRALASDSGTSPEEQVYETWCLQQ